jgi:microcystin-dependent protein
MAASTSSATGSSTPVSTMPPYVTVKCYIALQGIFPSRP